AMEYLIGQGRKKIACLAGFTDNNDAAERLNAYRGALREHGIEPDDRLVEYCNMTRMCRDEVEKLFKRNPDIDAVVCVNDETATTVYEYLNETGRAIGTEVAVVGFDDLSYAYKMDPPLSTVRADSASLGAHAVREGLKRLKSGEPVNRSVLTNFIKRASAGPENVENQVSVAEFDVNIEKMLMDLRTTNRAAKEMFSFNKYVDQNYAALLTGMNMLGIEYCYLYLLPAPVIHLQSDKWNRPKELMMKACLYGGNVMAIPKYRQTVPLNKMYSHSLMPKDRRYTMILIDLFSTDMQYGVAMMEFHFDKHYCIEALGYQMSAAVRMLQIMQAQEETQRQLEENNINLNIEAFSDGLTGLLNRRGFEEKADEVLLDIANQGKYILVAYADMDNLKIINDRFGHKEGDFALKACADMLREVFEGDIIGRIGGDEYAVVSLCDEPVNMKELRERAALRMARFNKESDRPYNVRFTIGGYTQSFLQGCRLSNMLENADNDLYEAKKLRDKDVMKV
ncbi:MAG: GGDEF domain-containing protein, partial [Butyrivibrio sp.]|nr:GGDEF domain-containing protein [Butyrivibrio sp.]